MDPPSLNQINRCVYLYTCIFNLRTFVRADLNIIVTAAIQPCSLQPLRTL